MISLKSTVVGDAACSLELIRGDAYGLPERLSAGTAGAGVSVETGRRVEVTKSMGDRAAPAVVQPRLVSHLFGLGARYSLRFRST